MVEDSFDINTGQERELRGWADGGRELRMCRLQILSVSGKPKGPA